MARIVPHEFGGFLSSFWFVTERKKPDVGGEDHHPATGERGPPRPGPQSDGCVKVAVQARPPPQPLFLPSPTLFAKISIWESLREAWGDGLTLGPRPVWGTLLLFPWESAI